MAANFDSLQIKGLTPLGTCTTFPEPRHATVKKTLEEIASFL